MLPNSLKRVSLHDCKWNPVLNTTYCIWSPAGISAPSFLIDVIYVVSSGKINGSIVPFILPWTY